MMRVERPGHRPGSFRVRRGWLGLPLVALVVGLVLLRSMLNLALLETSLELNTQRKALGVADRALDRERMQVERMVALASLEPRAREHGLVRPPAESVVLLAAPESTPFPRARPLGVPGAGALGRWFERAARAARVPSAVASETPPAAEPAAPARNGHAVPGAVTLCGRCDICKALAQGKRVDH
ncbi:MAG TPA: hypothetical protein VNM87_06785 [Candidatus Udaeobacter sp.]|nr:hypothetical protein [Candidatus Udaeobacter sp.]